MDHHHRIPDSLPLSGRSLELAHLRNLLDRASTGTGRSVLLRGEGGVGKTRLVEAIMDDARRRGWGVAVGRAYPVGVGTPFAPFQDAFVPVVRELDASALTVLTRGAEAELAQLFPALGALGALGAMGAPRAGDGNPSERKTRLFWNFAEFLKGLAARAPLLLVLEDLQWADESTLELLHFVARQLEGEALQLLGTYNDQYRTEAPGLVATEQSLGRLAKIEIIRLHPLSAEDVTELCCAMFGVEDSLVGDFAGRLHEWTGGNTYFVVETLRALVESGQLRQTEGTWVGFDTQRMKLPTSIREAVMARTVGLSENAETVVHVATALGSRVPYDVLRAVAGLTEPDLLEGLDALRRRRLIVESTDGDALHVEFSHPLVRETLHDDLGRARARSLHGRIAIALEDHYGDSAAEHADELAYHFGLCDQGASSKKTIAYLVTAGRQAFRRYAHGAAVDHLEAAVARLDGLDRQEGMEIESELGTVREDFAWALHAVGRVDEAVSRMEDLLRDGDDPARRSLVLDRLARARFWAGRYQGALECVERALGLAGGEASGKKARLLLLRGHCLEQLGRADDARSVFGEVLAAAVESGDVALEARAHQAHALLSLWVGRMDDVAPHAQRALELSRSVGASTVEFWSLWVQAAAQGLTGQPQAMFELEEQARAVARSIRAPHLRVWAAELRVEHASATGAWERGITIGEQAVSQARSLGQSSLLPRLQVWTGLIHLQRGDFDRARELLQDAWNAAVEGVAEENIDVHSYVPACTGRAAYLTATGSYDEAVAVAERALELSEQSGYFVWALHRLLPTLGEAQILRGDLEGAVATGARLRRYATRAGHQLGLAWADACDALVEWLSGNPGEAVAMLRTAAEKLEDIPFIWDAARIRRQMAGRLADLGKHEEATEELRRIHEVFVRLGAEAELEKTRTMFREVGARPPSRHASAGAGATALTAREVEIARMVAERKSNKAIARVLGISPRTVSTHVSNVFKKVGVSSRGELADLVRTTLFPD